MQLSAEVSSDTSQCCKKGLNKGHTLPLHGGWDKFFLGPATNALGLTRKARAAPKLARPELFRLLTDSHPDDVLLVEQVDRLSRLGTAD